MFTQIHGELIKHGSTIFNFISIFRHQFKEEELFDLVEEYYSTAVCD